MPLSPASSQRKGSLVSVYGPGGRKASVVSRQLSEGAATPASGSRKDSSFAARVNTTFAGSLRHLYLADNRLNDEVFEQITLLLNLGAVQEDERVLIEGIPYRVQNLDFYIDFTNPALEGADFTLPVRTVVGMHSRPSGANEPWFPTMRGDWTRLVDGRFGQVKSQSPDMVELEIPGGARMTYATADFLALKPENLSNGFRAEIVFGLSYRHQEELPGAIMDTLREHVREGVARLAPIGCLRDVDVSMLEAGDNAVNFEVEADLAGAAAPLLEDVERELVRLCVEACNRHGWEIPFPQLVIHKA